MRVFVRDLARIKNLINIDLLPPPRDYRKQIHFAYMHIKRFPRASNNEDLCR